MILTSLTPPPAPTYVEATPKTLKRVRRRRKATHAIRGLLAELGQRAYGALALEETLGTDDYLDLAVTA